MASGREAYEEDIRRCPAYHDGTPRKSWDELSSVVRDTWHRNPTAREYALRMGEAQVFNAIDHLTRSFAEDAGRL